jgi:hypothetical protein
MGKMNVLSSPKISSGVTSEDGRRFDLLPKVFIEGHTMTRIATSKKHVDCINYSSRPSSKFGGCFIYESDDIVKADGIYHIKNEPVFSIRSKIRIAENENEIIEIIKREITNFGKRLVKKDLLIAYDDYSVTVYNNYEKGYVIKFPLKAGLGDLKIIQVPRPVIVPSGHAVKEVKISDYRVEFGTEVVRFNIYSSNGNAELIFNPNSSPVDMKTVSINNDEKVVKIMPYEFYLVVHPLTQKRVSDNITAEAPAYLSRYCTEN